MCTPTNNNSTERKDYIANLDNLMQGTEMVILGGDFNCVENIVLDKVGCALSGGNDGADEIHNLKKDFGMCDIFRQ